MGLTIERRKPVLIIQHAEHEHPAALLRAIETQGILAQWIHPYLGEKYPDSRKIRGVISLGGPMNANDELNYPWIAEELKLLKACFKSRKAIVGICLGGQLLARALGAKVSQNQQPEIGWFPISLTPEGEQDPLLSAAGKRPLVYHWHFDTFDLPKNSALLAKSQFCNNQAYRVRSNTYGFQFHPEADLGLVREWLETEETQEEIMRLKKDHPEQCIQSPEQLRSSASVYEIASIHITAAVAQLFQDDVYQPISRALYSQLKAFEKKPDLIRVSYRRSDRKNGFIQGSTEEVFSVPGGEFLVLLDSEQRLWPFRLDHIYNLEFISNKNPKA